VPPFYREIAAETGCRPCRGSHEGGSIDRDLKSDFVHPNAKGYGEIAKAVEKALKRGGAI
jgi:lysophospholipase L1-like esterase